MTLTADRPAGHARAHLCMQQAQRRPKGAAVGRRLLPCPVILRFQPAGLDKHPSAASLAVSAGGHTQTEAAWGSCTPWVLNPAHDAGNTRQQQRRPPSPVEGGAAAADVEVRSHVVVVCKDLLGWGRVRWERSSR